MHLLGLVNGTSSIHLDEECRYFTWESLLSTKEVVAVKAALGDPYPGRFFLNQVYCPYAAI